MNYLVADSSPSDASDASCKVEQARQQVIVSEPSESFTTSMLQTFALKDEMVALFNTKMLDTHVSFLPEDQRASFSMRYRTAWGESLIRIQTAFPPLCMLVMDHDRNKLSEAGCTVRASLSWFEKQGKAGTQVECFPHSGHHALATRIAGRAIHGTVIFFYEDGTDCNAFQVIDSFHLASSVHAGGRANNSCSCLCVCGAQPT
jgi:hypothetical protein